MNRINLNLLDSSEEGYIYGFFVGDGYAYYNKKDRHYSVDFYLNAQKDKDIKERIVVLLKKIGLKYFEKKDKRSNSIRLRVHSKEFYYFIQNNSKKIENLPNLSYNYLIGYLSGFIDAEGYVTKGDIVITQKNKAILDEIVEICNILEIKLRKMWSFKNKKTPTKIWRLRISTKIKGYNHISSKINRIYAGSLSTIANGEFHL